LQHDIEPFHFQVWFYALSRKRLVLPKKYIVLKKESLSLSFSLSTAVRYLAMAFHCGFIGLVGGEMKGNFQNYKDIIRMSRNILHFGLIFRKLHI
jgi:hypothetical protein